MTTFATDKRALHVERVGAGPRVTVITHGFLGQGRNLRTLANRWAAKDSTRALWLIDLPGHGQSAPLLATESLRSMAEAVVETVRAQGHSGSFEWVGHSLGGRVGLAAADAFAGDLSRLVLLDIAPGPIAPETHESRRVVELLCQAPASATSRQAMRAALLALGLGEPTADWLLLNLASKPEDGVAWRIDRVALREFHARVSREDLWSVPAQRRVPMLLVRGSRSRLVGPDDVRRLESLGVEVKVVEAGHDVHAEAPDAVLAAIA